MHLAESVFGMGKHNWHSRFQSSLFVAHHSYHMQAQSGDGLEKVDEGGLILLTQPAAAQRQAGLQFPHHPQLRFAPLRAQSIQAQDQPALLRHRSQLVQVLPLVAGQQGQVPVVIKMAHLRLADLKTRLQDLMNRLELLVVRLPQPADLGNHIVAVGAMTRRDLLPPRRLAQNVEPGTIQVRTVSRLVSDRPHASHGLHRFGPTRVGHLQRPLALWTDTEFKAVHNRLFPVKFSWGSHGLLLPSQDGAILP